MVLSRRRFFTQSGLLTAGSISAPAFVEAAPNRSFRRGQRPKHIIQLVADGMSAGTLTCANALSELRRGQSLQWIQLYQNPAAHHGLMDMRSLNSLVTDSSAASSSWGSGSRIGNGAVNVLPDGRELTPLYTLFGQQGWKRGLVTTTEITHATPAGFAANDSSRGSAETIAAQYLQRRVDVLLGGGANYFRPDKRADKRDLFSDYSAAGYHVMRTSRDLDTAPAGKRWLGVFARGHLPYTLDHLQSVEDRVNIPTLAQMTGAALARLRNENHFILQVEGGRVDHGCHSCDAAAALNDQLAFDEALQVCLNFQREVPDTLLVITTDHGNGNMGLTGMGDGYADSSRLFKNLNRVNASFEEITRTLKGGLSVPEIQTILGDRTGYKASTDEAEMLSAFLEKKGKTLFKSLNSVNAQLGQLMGNHTGIAFTSGAHTADYVQISAVGPGAEKFGGFIPNTDVFHHYLKFAKIDFRNPSLPLQAAAFPPQNLEELPGHVNGVSAVA